MKLNLYYPFFRASILRCSEKQTSSDMLLNNEETAVMFDEDAYSEVPPPHIIGEDISLLSATEIEYRIALLRAEIQRLQGNRFDKDKSRQAAEALFRLG